MLFAQTCQYQIQKDGGINIDTPVHLYKVPCKVSALFVCNGKRYKAVASIATNFSVCLTLCVALPKQTKGSAFVVLYDVYSPGMDIQDAVVQRKATNYQALIFGTFDLFHDWHKSYIHQASYYADSVYAVVAREKTVQRVKNKTPQDTESERLSKVLQYKYTNYAILGKLEESPYICIQEIVPRVIVLGYDQEAFVDKLHTYLKTLTFQVDVVRAKAYKPEVYKTTLLVKKEGVN